MQNYELRHLSCEGAFIDNPGPDLHWCECTASTSQLWRNNRFFVVGLEHNQA